MLTSSVESARLLNPTPSVSSVAFEAELILPLKPSNWLLSITLILHFSLALLVCWMPLSLFWQTLIISSILIAAAHYYIVQHHQLAQRQAYLIWHEFGAWELRQNRQAQAVHLTNYFSSRWLTILHFHTKKRQWRVILLADNLPIEQGRLLRRRLKLLA